MSSDEGSNLKGQQSDNSSSEEEDEEIVASRKKSKLKSRFLIDSDDEEVNGKGVDDEAKDKGLSDSDSGSDKSSSKPKKSGRINRSRLMNSSDEESSSETEVKTKQKSSNLDSLIDEDDEDENEVRPKRADNSSDEDSDNDSCSRSGGHYSDDNDYGPMPDESAFQGKAKKGENRQSRKSKEAALKEIYSESSRMLRESQVGLPYHRPRQRTLDEFLNRKKGSLDLIDDMKKLPKVGSNIEDVAKVDKIFEERQKLAENFFKEDENEEESIDGPSPMEVDNEKEDSVTNELVEPSPGEDEPANPNPTMDVEQPVDLVTEPTLPDTNDEKTKEPKEPITGVETSEPVETGNDKSLDEPKTSEPQPLVSNGSVEDDDFHLFLEPDSIEEEWIPTSQKSPTDSTINEKSSSILTKRLVGIVDQSLLSLKPKINREEIEIVFGDEPDTQELSGLEHLKNRFVRHVRARGNVSNVKKGANVISVVRKETDAGGVVRLKEESFNYEASEARSVRSKVVDFEEVRKAQKSERPGAQQVALKMTLKQQIMEEKRRERMEKEERKKLENEEGEGEEEGEPEEDILDDEDVEDEEEETDEEVEDEEEEEEEEADEDDDIFDVTERRKNRIKSAFIDDEAEDTNDGADGDEAKDDGVQNVANDEDSEFNFGKNIGRRDQAAPIVSARQQVNKTSASKGYSSHKLGETEDSPFTDTEIRWTPLDDDGSEDEHERKGGARKKLGFEGLFDQSDPNPDNFDDVIGLCSGKFVTQQPMDDDDDGDDDTVGDDDGGFEALHEEATPDTVVLTKELTQNLTSYNRTKSKEKDTQDTVLMSDDEDKEERAPGFMEEYPGFLDSTDSEGENETSIQERKKKKKCKRIEISEDEASDNENNVKDDDAKDSDVGSDAEEENREVMYDSEENEIEVDAREQKFKGFVEKKGRIRGEFLEAEAELSGSEDDSEDEDERGLDRLMAEDGDLDDVDEEAVRDEIGRIHHRQLLDDDQRDVRLFQEAFLEDGELHSENGRTRRFKWKDTDDDFDNNARSTLSDGEDDADGDKDVEKWRIERLEREKWMLEKSKEENKVEAEHDGENHNDSKFFNVASKVMKKLDSKPKKNADSTMNFSNATKIFKSPKAKLPLQNVSGNKRRGSFLSRDSSTLEKLAEMTKSASAPKSGSGAKNSKNFIFAVVSPPKADESSSSGSSEAKEKRKNVTAKKSLSEPLSKKPKLDRTIDENSRDTIFGAI